MAGKKSTETVISIEDSITRLEEIVEQLEEDSTTLDRAVALFEEGMVLAQSSREILAKAELRVRILREGSDGESIEESFDDFIDEVE